MKARTHRLAKRSCSTANTQEGHQVAEETTVLWSHPFEAHVTDTCAHCGVKTGLVIALISTELSDAPVCCAAS